MCQLTGLSVRGECSAGMQCALLATLAAVLTTGCATIIKGTTQSIPVASDPPAADVVVDGNLAGQTPTSVNLQRKTDHLLTIRKVGYEPQTVAVVKNVGGAVWGNVLAGGLIGWGVDAASGAQYNLAPSTVSVKLALASTAVAGMNGDDSSVFVDKLKALDQLHESKQLSDADYLKSRVELFKRYLPEALPAEQAPAAK